LRQLPVGTLRGLDGDWCSRGGCSRHCLARRETLALTPANKQFHRTVPRYRMNTPLWLALCDQWVAEGRGYTGVTVPFLVGAARHSGTTELVEVPSQKDLAKLLFDIQNQCPTNRSVRIEMCGTREKPVVKVADLSEVQDIAEQIRARRGESRLYISQTYPHERTLDSAVEALWNVVGNAISSRAFSYAGNNYRPFNNEERAFIERATRAA
jgi:hypothetical protein